MEPITPSHNALAWSDPILFSAAVTSWFQPTGTRRQRLNRKSLGCYKEKHRKGSMHITPFVLGKRIDLDESMTCELKEIKGQLRRI